MTLLTFVLGTVFGMWLYYKFVRAKLGIQTHSLQRALWQAKSFNDGARRALGED